MLPGGPGSNLYSRQRVTDREMMTRDESRVVLKECSRVVVKAGSRVLVQRNGRPDQRRLQALVSDLSSLHRKNRDVILVSSGAVGAGMEALGLKTRPDTLPDLQMAAAVGQSRLMTRYDRLFEEQRIRVGQVLLTHDALKQRQRHLNARNTMLNLLRHRIIPVVNENDVISTEEIQFGDNDQLAALVAMLVDADLLILLTSADGLRESSGPNRTRRVAWIPEINAEVMKLVRDEGGGLGRGGMASKLESAGMAAEMGIPVVIANGRRSGVVADILAGRDVGTLIGTPGSDPTASSRKRWIAFFHRAAGTLVIDDGAKDALQMKGKSLLPIGIRNVVGDFPAGSMVNIRTQSGDLVARGLTDYRSEDLREVMGKKTADIRKQRGCVDYDEAIHRDNLVLCSNGSDR